MLCDFSQITARGDLTKILINIFILFYARGFICFAEWERSGSENNFNATPSIYVKLSMICNLCQIVARATI